MQVVFKGMDCLLVTILLVVQCSGSGLNIKFFTVGTDMNDGLRRLISSANTVGADLEIIGLGQKWQGGDMQAGEGGAHKIHLFKEALKPHKDNDKLIVVFMDAYDVIFTKSPAAILDSFLYEYKDYRVLFSAEGYCWPDASLSAKYPLVKFGKRYLNSGLYMGYANEIYQILDHQKDIKPSEDDQLYFTKIYIDEPLRQKHKIILDSMAYIFQNLHGAQEDVYIEYADDEKATINNIIYNTHPALIHGNGPSKFYLNHLSNYVPQKQSKSEGCLWCNKIDFEAEVAKKVGLALFVFRPIPFVEEFLAKIMKLEYDFKNIELFIYNNQAFHFDTIEKFIKNNEKTFGAVTSMNGAYTISEREARNSALEWGGAFDYLLILDGDVHLTNGQALNHLIATSESLEIGILTPVITQIGKLFSNFWGDISKDGFYARSSDYMAIVNKQIKGIWNSPFVTGAVLIKKEYIAKLSDSYETHPRLDPDMSFCAFARSQNIFMFADNTRDYGFLVVSDDFDLSKDYKHPEMYQIFDNRQLWIDRYLHPRYYEFLAPEKEVDQACPDVYDYPLMSERFCAEMIEEMEHFGKWSAGKNTDDRLAGGYENVPTRDIHMNQVGFERHWLYFMDEFVRPMQEKVFVGYYHVPVESNMMFVVRYKPEEQAALRPHHDASTFSIDIALNKRGVDYQGGGVRYIRYNCTVPADEVGWTMMFPGRLTHMHEGLPTTQGTRYIMVSFLNP